MRATGPRNQLPLKLLQVRRNTELVQPSTQVESRVAVIDPEAVDLDTAAEGEARQAAEVVDRQLLAHEVVVADAQAEVFSFTEEELAAAKQGYLEKQKVTRSEDSQLAATLRSNLFVGRSMEYYADLENKINALTVEDVNAALRKYIDPAHIALAVAGDFKEAE